MKMAITIINKAKPIINTNGNHNGLVTHHQFQSIFSVSLSVVNTINITTNILELMGVTT